MSGEDGEERMDKKLPGYQRWLAERSCTEYKHFMRSGSIRPKDDYRKVEFMFSKKIKLLLCDSDMAVFLVTENGEVYHWWDVAWTDPSLKYYTQMIDLRDAHFVQTATGGNSTFLALTENNELYYFRTYENNGLFGWMRQVNISKRITCISCGEAFFVAVTDDYTVYSWGKNNDGQLGISTCTTDFIEDPQEIKFIGSKIVKVACGFKHTLALTSMGKIFVWGGNDFGELGLSHRNSIPTPVMIEVTSNIMKILDIAAMKNMSCAICEDRLIYVWGSCFDQQIRNAVSCEYTTIFDVCNALTARPPTTVKYLNAGEKANILKDLGSTFNDPSTSDLTIEVEGKSIYVYKAVLQIRSLFFKNMFPSELLTKNSLLRLTQFSYVTYHAYFQYLYTGEFKLSLEEKFELLKLADTYNELGLEKSCFRAIKTEVTVANAIPIFKMARELNKKVLEEYCLHFCAEHRMDVEGLDNFVEELDTDTKKIYWVKVLRLRSA